MNWAACAAFFMCWAAAASSACNTVNWSPVILIDSMTLSAFSVRCDAAILCVRRADGGNVWTSISFASAAAVDAACLSADAALMCRRIRGWARSRSCESSSLSCTVGAHSSCWRSDPTATATRHSKFCRRGNYRLVSTTIDHYDTSVPSKFRCENERPACHSSVEMDGKLRRSSLLEALTAATPGSAHHASPRSGLPSTRRRSEQLAQPGWMVIGHVLISNVSAP